MPRLTIDVGTEFDGLLSELAKEKESTKAEIIRRAVASYAYLKKHAADNKVSITDADNKVLKDVVLP
jgi:predicted transcriptional regulator